MSQQLWPELVSVNAIHHKSFLLQLPHEHLCFSRSDCLFALHTSILLQTDSLLTLITLFASFSLLIETSLSLFSLVIPSHSSTSNCASFLFWLCLDVFVIHILYEEPMLTADILFTYDNHTLKPSSDETMLNLELVDTLWAFFSETPLKITLLHKFFLLPLRTPIWSCLSLCPAIFWERSRSSCSSHRHELYPDVFYLWSFLVELTSGLLQFFFFSFIPGSYLQSSPRLRTNHLNLTDFMINLLTTFTTFCRLPRFWASDPYLWD